VDPVRALQHALQHALYRAVKADPGRRFHSLWDKFLRRDVLWRAWIVVRRNNGAPGIDKTTLADVEEYGVARLLDELVADLRSGSYRPLPARRVFIPKPASPGERRPLSIPSGSGSDRAGRGEDRARADLRGGHAAVQLRVLARARRA
jgi:RNA-directed DNA polymerase